MIPSSPTMITPSAMRSTIARKSLPVVRDRRRGTRPARFSSDVWSTVVVSASSLFIRQCRSCSTSQSPCPPNEVAGCGHLRIGRPNSCLQGW
jgi:hypothetical protein